MKKIIQFFLNHESLIVLLFALLTSISAIMYFHVTDQILLYNDARSHLDIARRVTDSITPGLMQLGSVWLPLFHILMLPFIQNDFLWQTGLAGAIVSGSAYILAVFFIYKILRLISSSHIIAFLGTLIFALNPNLLYLQAVPLDEVLAVSMATASLYFLLSWTKRKYIPHLMAAGFFALLGSLSRYEVWFLVAAESVYVFLITLMNVKQNALKKAEGLTIFFASLAFFGVFLWFLYNLLGWGDPLYFINHPGGHVDQQEEFKRLGLLPTEGNLLQSFLVFMSNILEDIGPALLIATGLSLMVLWKQDVRKKLYYLVSLAPLGFIFLSLYFGITVLFTKTFPLLGTEKVFNVRYGIIALIPAVIILTSAFELIRQNIRSKLWTSLGMGSILFLDILFFIHTAPIAVIDDGSRGVSGYGQADEDTIAQKVREHCRHDYTLISANKNEIIMFESGFPMKSFIYEGSGKYWEDALINPEEQASCILIARGGQLWDNFTNHPERLKRYSITYTSTSGDNVLYTRNPEKKIKLKKASPKKEIETVVSENQINTQIQTFYNE